MSTIPNISRRRDETSRTEPDAPLEPAPLDFACRASKRTNKIEPTFGLRDGMDECRRLKAMYPNASYRELAEFQVFGKAVAGYREDRRGSEGRGGDHREDSGDDQRRGRHNSRKDSRDSRKRRPVTDLLGHSGGKRRVIVPATALAPISLAEKTDVVVTGVEERKIEIARQTQHLQLDQPRPYNLLHPLSQDYSISRLLQYIMRPQANPRPKHSRACQRFRPAPARDLYLEARVKIKKRLPRHQRLDEVAHDPFRHC